MLKEISVLCTLPNSVYKQLPGVDAYDLQRDAYTFSGNNPIIAHPPCQQWSRMKNFANDNPREKELAIFCLEQIHKNGGILEHPAGSSFFKYAGIVPTISVNQAWFGFPCQKKTYLYFFDCEPLAFPLSFDCPVRTVSQLTPSHRSITTIQFATWLLDCVRSSQTNK